ncbi:acyl-CoA dehydrogenase family protein [Mycolicibacterium tokaiense]|uniref:Medium-chain specific acyl-CoA dehydrogenase, mitochondrial n=1 Tax=Mycolicibacterium tokaiense TaxID=39695 RepID=A0A378TKF5_9MYCO|nr:acyl-CoA dehydrogenase family protein [Mycolicibacterium tokaiense]BBY84263.1 butyryl-CoA dehydrogenase [Mycolicibacterium tokaiense]STZ61229.1 acyl-CoA dehydrogenase [Mycolicibacterium tokaiense]
MYGLNADDLRIRNTAATFAESLMSYEVDAELAGGQLPAEIAAAHHHRALELGLYATNIPAAAGGVGCTALQQVLVQEQVGRVTNGLAWVMHTPPQWWVDVATDFQRERWLAPAVRGEKHEAYAITEEFAGSDVSDLRTSVRKDGDEYVVNGVKWHVTSFNLADYLFVQGVLDNGDFAGEHVLLVVDLPWPGVEVVRTPHYSHHIADEHPIVSFTDVRVPASHLVGAEGAGMTFTQDWFRFERLMVAARCVGAGQRLVDEMTAFAKSRVVAGKPLGEHQLVAGMLADSATELFAARTMLYEVARAIDAGGERKTLHGLASMAKLYCSEMAGRVADRAVQVFGGRGYMRENVAERMFRELRVERIWEGASEIQRLIVARQLLKGTI